MDDSFFSSEFVSEFEEADGDYGTNLQSVQSASASCLMEYEPSSSIDSSDEEADCNNNVNLSVQEVDLAEEHAIEEFMRETCKCHYGIDGRACSCQFEYELIASTRMNCLEMTKSELDLVILAHLEANRRCFDDQEGSRVCINYWFKGYRVCKSTYLFLHCMGAKKYKNLITHYCQNGLIPRKHGNTRRLPASTIPFEVTQSIVQFIENTAEVHALPLPGRMPGQYSDKTALLLPTSMTKRYIYRKYRETADNPISRRKFETLWNQLLPHIAPMKPKTDLCEICHENIVKIARSANLPESEKSSQLLDAECHLEKAHLERQVYNEECINAKSELSENPLNPKFIHVSFDYAQQIHLPCSPQQVGPLYFLTPRKCQLFGVCNEARCEQVNYLIDENDIVGKGANSVVSMVHHYLEANALPSQELLLHADNAVGQNKNNCVMQYLCWRTLTGRSTKIKMSFMLAGHTKFAPDRFFGLLKKAYRRTSVSSLPELVKMVSDSSIAGKNIPQLTIDCFGKRHVVWYDWSNFMSKYFSTIPGILQYHHFRFDSSFPGKVFVKYYSNSSSEDVIGIINDVNSLDVLDMPNEVVPAGMSLERQVYLYEKIRQFCSSTEAAALTCPLPSRRPEPSTVKEKLKQPRKCSHCHQPGHTRQFVVLLPVLSCCDN